MSWSELCLGDVLAVKHGFAFKSTHFADAGHHVVLTPGNFNEAGGFRTRPGKDRYYTGEIPEGFVLRRGDLIVAMTEQGPGLLGSSALVPDDDKYLHNQRLGLVHKLDERRLDRRFVYYLFNTRDVRAQINGSATGTKVRHTAPERIYRVRVRVPASVRDQARIAGTLSAYDDLIENNRRRIQLLEESARLLYKEWFVRLRFPGHEHVKVVDGVPEGWERVPVSQAVTFLNRGIAPHYDDDAPGLVINQKCIRDGRVDLSLARHQSRAFKPERQVQAGDVLINSTGEGTLGRVAQLYVAQDNCTVDTHVTIVRPGAAVPRYYFGQALQALEPVLATMGRGATNQTELSRDQIGAIELVIPSRSTVLPFEDATAASRRQVWLLSEQSKKLAAARNLLLPRLMSGEVAV